jgi:hypothetical protein
METGKDNTIPERAQRRLSKGLKSQWCVYLKTGRHEMRRKSFTGDEILDGLLREEKMLTHTWYEKMRGAVPWNPGEREAFARQFESMEMKIDHRIGKKESKELTAVLHRVD